MAEMTENHTTHSGTVTMSPARTADDEGKGVGAIIRAFIKNPVAAAQIFGVVAFGFAFYYGTGNKIETARAESEQHYKDIATEIRVNNEKVAVHFDGIVADNLTQNNDIKALFSRGDTRWTSIGDKLSELGTRATKSEDKLEYIIAWLGRHDNTVMPPSR